VLVMVEPTNSIAMGRTLIAMLVASVGLVMPLHTAGLGADRAPATGPINDRGCCSERADDSHQPLQVTSNAAEDSQRSNPPDEAVCDCNCCMSLAPSVPMLAGAVSHLLMPDDLSHLIRPASHARPQTGWLGVPLQPPIL
jgi:hypothetical protein